MDCVVTNEAAARFWKKYFLVCIKRGRASEAQEVGISLILTFLEKSVLKKEEDEGETSRDSEREGRIAGEVSRIILHIFLLIFVM